MSAHVVESSQDAEHQDHRPMRTARRVPKRLVDLLAVLLGASLFLIAWKIVIAIGNYPSFILPAPELVAERFATAWRQGTFTPHLITTLTEVGLGFLIGASTGVLVGYLLARSAIAERVLSPYIVAAQSTPILALAPLIALWFGSGLTGKVLICALIVFFPIAVSTMVGVRSVDARLLELGRSMRASRRQMLTTFEIPAALPQILGGMRVGMTLAVVGAIVGEWAGGERGLGVLINLARGSLFDIPLMFATLLLIGIVGVVLYLLVLVIERRLVGTWREAA